jgi:hypothetical protein
VGFGTKCMEVIGPQRLERNTRRQLAGAAVKMVRGNLACWTDTVTILRKEMFYEDSSRRLHSA